MNKVNNGIILSKSSSLFFTPKKLFIVFNEIVHCKTMKRFIEKSITYVEVQNIRMIISMNYFIKTMNNSFGVKNNELDLESMISSR